MSFSDMFIVFPSHYMALSRPPGNRMLNFVHSFTNLVFSSPYLTPASSYSSVDPPSWPSWFMLMISSSLGLMRLFCTRPVHTFSVKDLSHACYFLGVELARSSHDLYLTQHKYTVDIIYDIFPLSASSTSTPLPKGLRLCTDDGALLLDLAWYRRFVGRLLYLNFTHSDITFAVHQLSQFVGNPRLPHWDVPIHLLRYLKGSLFLGLFFLAHTSFSLKTFAEAD